MSNDCARQCHTMCARCRVRDALKIIHRCMIIARRVARSSSELVRPLHRLGGLPLHQRSGAIPLSRQECQLLTLRVDDDHAGHARPAGRAECAHLAATPHAVTAFQGRGERIAPSETEPTAVSARKVLACVMRSRVRAYKNYFDRIRRMLEASVEVAECRREASVAQCSGVSGVSGISGIGGTRASRTWRRGEAAPVGDLRTCTVDTSLPRNTVRQNARPGLHSSRARRTGCADQPSRRRMPMR